MPWRYILPGALVKSFVHLIYHDLFISFQFYNFDDWCHFNVISTTPEIGAVARATGHQGFGPQNLRNNGFFNLMSIKKVFFVFHLLSKHFVFNFVFNLLLISVFCFSLLVIPLVIPCFSLFVGPIRWGKGVECIFSQAKDQSDQQVSCPTVTLIQTIETLLMEFGWKTWWKLHVYIFF